MSKKHKISIIIGSIIIILPIFIGIFLWDQLPEQIATHFDSNNEPNGWTNKAFTVFGIPLFILAAHIGCVLGTAWNPKRQNINVALTYLFLWMIPVISLFVVPSCYAYELGYQIDFAAVLQLLIGIIFLVAGFNMRTLKQNSKVGIKTAWTIKSEANWNATHRFASWFWMLSGLVLFINIIVKSEYLVLIAILITTLLPILYSFILHKKGI